MRTEEPSGSLARLIKAEEAHAHRLALAREEARRLVTQARTDAARADSDLEAELQQSGEALKNRFQAERASRFEELTGQVQRYLAKLDGLGERHVLELAAERIPSVME